MLNKINSSRMDALWLRDQIVDRQSKMGARAYTKSNVMATKLTALFKKVSKVKIINEKSYHQQRNRSRLRKGRFEGDIQPIYTLAKDLRKIAPVKKR